MMLVTIGMAEARGLHGSTESVSLEGVVVSMGAGLDRFQGNIVPRSLHGTRVVFLCHGTALEGKAISEFISKNSGMAFGMLDDKSLLW